MPLFTKNIPFRVVPSAVVVMLLFVSGLAEGTRYCQHCQWNQSVFTCGDPVDYHSVACPSDTQKCLKIDGNFTAWNDQTARYSVISGIQRVCLTSISAQHLVIRDQTAACRSNVSTDTTIGPWRFVFHGDYCICDKDNCNDALQLASSCGLVIASIFLVSGLFTNAFMA